ncbi:MAG: ComEC/Rec2 family competence protein [Acidimicrobiia bacterium]
MSTAPGDEAEAAHGRVGNSSLAGTGSDHQGFELYPVLLAVGVAGGAYVGDRLGAGSGGYALVGAGVVGVAALVARGDAATRVRAAAILLVAFLLGGAAMQRALDGMERSPLTESVDQRADVVVTGTVVGDPDVGRFSTRVQVRATRFALLGDSSDIAWRTAGGRHLLVEAGAPTAGRIGQLEAGDAVVLRGWLSPLTGYDRRYARQHVVGRMGALDLVDFADPSSPVLAVANPIRRAVLAGIDPLPDPERGLVAGFLLGDRRAIPDDMLDDFRDAGLTHLLAVSGSNVAFVLALAAPLLLRLGPLGRIPASLLVLVVFAAMTRFEPSVLRASTMAAASLAGVLVGRPVSGSRALGLAVAVLVLLDPFLVFSVAFLLSVGASAGIVALAVPIAHRLRGPSFVRLPLAVTVAAQIGVTPVLLTVFGSVPLVSVPANLLAVPVAGPITTLGFAAGISDAVLGWWLPALPALFRIPTFLAARWVETVAEVAARLPVDVGRRGGVALLVAVAAMLAVRRLVVHHAGGGDTGRR